MIPKFSPKLRKEVLLDLKSSLDGIVQRYIETSPFPFQNCLSCCHFIEQTEVCRQFNAKPPARVICFGCDKFEDVNQIPF